MGGNNHCLRALADEVKREYCAGERYLARSADSKTKCRVLEAMYFDQAQTHYHNNESVVSFYRKLVSLPPDCVSSFLSTQALLETRRMNLAREIRMVERSICFDRHPPNVQRALVAVISLINAKKRKTLWLLLKFMFTKTLTCSRTALNTSYHLSVLGRLGVLLSQAMKKRICSARIRTIRLCL